MYDGEFCTEFGDSADEAVKPVNGSGFETDGTGCDTFGEPDPGI